MATQRIDGKLFEQMVANGLNNIILNEKTVNEMNVFPVPDGDTGTNMRLTLSFGVNKATSTVILSDYVEQLSKGMLLGARGNSGVILSQIFKGFSTELKSLDSMNTSDFLRALICGYKTAYASVINPIEGTVLTVAREGTEYVSKSFDSDTSFEKILEIYIKGMKQSLKRTPELLPVLKQAGVEDSGAFGFIIIIEGMFRFLCGERIGLENEGVHENKETGPDLEAFTSDSPFEYGYCMEFLLRLMKAKTKIETFDVGAFTKQLETMGESVVCVMEGSVVKVHIHVFKPSKVIELAQRFGEFLTFKLENMSLQHNEKSFSSMKQKKHFPLTVIAVGNGPGIKETLKAFEHVIYIDGGSTMNTSTEEFVKAIEAADADFVVIMPNNKNIVKSARQAVEILNSSKVEIIETANVAQCYYALSMDMPQDNPKERIRALRQACTELKSLCVFKSVRTCTLDGIDCVTGDYICSTESGLVASGTTLIQALENGIKKTNFDGNCEMCFAFTGRDFSNDEEVRNLFDREFANLSLELIPGGQEHRELVIGIV